MREQIEGQISIFEVADKPLKFHEAEWLKGHGFKNVYDEPPKAGIYEFTDIEYPTKVKKFEVAESGAIKLGSSDFVARWWRPITEDKVCSFSGHTCNKKNLWEIADTLDILQCPHVCCRKCNTRNCGVRCNGSEEPKGETDDYIREHPDCFYVYGHYLSRSDGWHKVPDELPTYTEWTVIDVVLYGQKTGTPWMEHKKWEAKDWTFRSIDQRRDTESTEILAWAPSERGEDGKNQNTCTI